MQHQQQQQPKVKDHHHNFLGQQHDAAEFRTWMVIYLCSACCIAEVVCGVQFGSLAVIADGIHMFTHSLAFFISAMAYKFSRKHLDDDRFSFGTAKMGDLGAYTSAIILVVISIYIIYDGIYKMVVPEPLYYLQVLPVACAGLFVNVMSGLLLAGCFAGDSEDGHGHGHDHSHGHSHGHTQEVYDYDDCDDDTGHDHSGCGGHDHSHGHSNALDLEHTSAHSHGEDCALDHGHGHSHEERSAFLDHSHVEEPEDSEHGHGHDHSPSSSDHDGGHDHSSDSLCHDGHDHDHVALFISKPGDPDLGTHPTPPAPAPAPGVTSFITRKFQAIAQIGHDKHEIDNNFRATFFHVVADAFVSMLVIFALVIAGNVSSLYFFDPMMGIIGSGVILSWAWQLILDSGANLLDMNPDKAMCQALRKCLERDGSSVKDLHVWRLGPGHLGAVISVAPPSPCSEGAKYSAAYYHSKMSGFRAISHVTVEVL